MKLDIDTLRRAPAFAALSTEASQALALCFRGRRYAAGQVVFREGDPAASLLFVADGELEANAHVGGAPSRLGRIGSGQLVGESALIDATPRTATVTAARPSVVYEIGEESVEILRRAAPTAARALTGAAIVGVVRHLRHLQQRIERELDRVGAMP
jgi:CRP/FNR family transcriptional regulator, cyclic AMP receptor protein